MVKDVVIKRSKWLRGEGSPYSFLIRYSDEKMCCLGFLGIACGIDPSLLIGRPSPADVKGSKDKWPANTFIYEGGVALSNIIHEAIMHNDDPELTEDVREAFIKEDFNKLGVGVVFED